MKITMLYQVSHYIRVKKQRNIKSWDQQNHLVIRGFCYIRPRYNEVPLYIIWGMWWHIWIFVDPKKIETIRSWPTPTSVKELCSFLGLASYYRRFVAGFTGIAAPLHALVRKWQLRIQEVQEKTWRVYSSLQWSEEAQQAFNSLKNAMISTPVLGYPQFDKPFVVEIDA